MKTNAQRLAASLLGGVFTLAVVTPPAAAARRPHLPVFHRHQANLFKAWNDGDRAALDRVEAARRTAVAAMRQVAQPDDDAYGLYFSDHPDDPLAPDFLRAVGSGIEMSNNCYSFAVGRQRAHVPFAWPAPGGASGIFFNMSRETDGAYVARLAEADGVRPLPNDAPAPDGFYRVALFIAPGEEFHWYREAPDRTWYHKRGHSPVTDRDASGHLIRDPRRADRLYRGVGIHGGDVDYTEFVGYFAVPEAGIDLDTPASRNQHPEGEADDLKWLDKLQAASQSVWTPKPP